jgi:beta-xylosidase
MKIIKRLFVVILVSINTITFAQKNYISNPIVPGYFADPCIITANNKFYLYATIDPWGGDSLAFFVSTDLKNWERKPLNWPVKAQCTSKTANDSKVWAPSVIKGKDGKYHMFVSVGSEVYAGVSDAPEGPWKNVKADGGPFIATQKPINVHTIDAEVFLDDNGKAYLYWGSGWNWKDGHCFVAALNEKMDAFTSTPKDITPPGYFEAPYMLKRNGIYYLMYSDGKCTDSTYKVRYSTANNPIGPWTQGKKSPVLATSAAKNIIGPGHHTILLYNKKYYIIYHRIANTNTQAKDLLREICIDELSFDKANNINIVNPSPKRIKNFIK